MFKLGSRGLRRMTLASGFLVLAIFSDSGVRMNKHASLVRLDLLRFKMQWCFFGSATFYEPSR